MRTGSELHDTVKKVDSTVTSFKKVIEVTLPDLLSKLDKFTYEELVRNNEQLVASEKKIKDLVDEYKEEERKQSVELDLKLKTNKIQLMKEVALANNYAVLEMRDYTKMEKEIADNKVTLKTAVTKATNSLRNEMTQEIALLKSSFDAEKATLLSQNEAALGQNEYLKNELTTLRSDIQEARKQMVEISQANSAVVNVSEYKK